MSQRAILEVAVDSVAGACAAERAGAARVELCAELVDGGVTPSAGSLAAARARVGIPLVALVRPRSGDFLYDDVEHDVLLRDIDAAKAARFDGVALGALTAAGDVDRARLADLIARARPLAVTFHRAFDMTRHPLDALDDLIELGVDRVLSSGQQRTALAGAELLARLVAHAGDRIAVIPAGGVRAHDAAAILDATGARELHSGARVRAPRRMQHENPACALGADGTRGELAHWSTDEEGVRQLVAALRSP